MLSSVAFFFRTTHIPWPHGALPLPLGYILPLLVAPGWKIMFIPECRLYSESAAPLAPRPSPKRSSRTHFYQAPIGLPRWFHGKESTCQCRRHRFNPWVKKILGERNGNPLQYSCLRNPMDTGAWWDKQQLVPRLLEKSGGLGKIGAQATCQVAYISIKRQ